MKRTPPGTSQGRNPKMKYIVRYEYGRTRAWWVRIERPGFVKRKLFSDSVYGGKRKALQTAQKYRDSLCKMAPPRVRKPLELNREGSFKRQQRWVYTVRNGRKCKTHQVDTWIAWIRVAPDRLASTNWSIEKWGVREAKRRMLQWLEQKRKEQRKNYRGIKSAETTRA
jgi:hypothetical protein